MNEIVNVLIPLVVYIVSDKPEALLNAGVAALICVAFDAAILLAKSMH